MPDPSPSTLTVLNSNFLQLGRRSEWWPATADSLP